MPRQRSVRLAAVAIAVAAALVLAVALLRRPSGADHHAAAAPAAAAPPVLHDISALRIAVAAANARLRATADRLASTGDAQAGPEPVNAGAVDRARALAALAAAAGESPQGIACSKIRGDALVREIAATAVVPVPGVACFTYQSHNGPGSFCDVSAGAVLDTRKVRLGLKSGWAGEEGHLTYDRGALSIAVPGSTGGALQLSGAHLTPTYADLYGSAIMDPTALDAAHCDVTYDEPVIAVTRNEWAHLLFSLCEAVNAYAGLEVALGTDPLYRSRVRVLLLDTHPPGPYAGFFEALSPGGPPILYGRDLHGKGRVCFKRLITSINGYHSFMLTAATGDASPCRGSSLLAGVRAAVMELHGLIDARPSSRNGTVHVTLVSRRPYEHEGFRKSSITRAVTNEDQLAQAVHSELPGVAFAAVDFARLNLREQLETVARTDVLVGMHGAGLMQSVFMSADESEHTVVVEIFPTQYGENHRDRNVARLMNRNYLVFESPTSGQLQEASPDPVRFVNVLRSILPLTGHTIV
eukprot:TRINITY_DN4749_c0_g1_i1.p1 TRINITY_DN4749_c0_g1~~TRINITY_DN4749_c0_g1_i1.p1  ORF type:complete len:535 (-),score=106.15 TRINITY_DN4749_c0_g1_i1:43-1617(-)